MTQPTTAPKFFDHWLFGACVVFGLMGIGWVLLGSFDPFGIWDGLLATAFYDGTVPADVERFRRFILGPLGATAAGFFFATGCIVRLPFRRREPWAFWAVAGACWLWFLVDATASLAHGAVFNVLLVDVPCITVLSIPLIALRSEFDR